MRTQFTLDCEAEFGFSIFAINSHVKGYKLCWNINKALHLCFEKTNDHNIEKDFWFSRYKYICIEGIEYNLLANRSKKGYLIPKYKAINFFLIIENNQDHEDFILKLRKVKDVLLVFELEARLIKHIDRFIFK